MISRNSSTMKTPNVNLILPKKQDSPTEEDNVLQDTNEPTEGFGKADCAVQLNTQLAPQWVCRHLLAPWLQPPDFFMHSALWNHTNGFLSSQLVCMASWYLSSHPMSQLQCCVLPHQEWHPSHAPHIQLAPKWLLGHLTLSILFSLPDRWLSKDVPNKVVPCHSWYHPKATGSRVLLPSHTVLWPHGQACWNPSSGLSMRHWAFPLQESHVPHTGESLSFDGQHCCCAQLLSGSWYSLNNGHLKLPTSLLFLLCAGHVCKVDVHVKADLTWLYDDCHFKGSGEIQFACALELGHLAWGQNVTNHTNVAGVIPHS